MSQPPPRAICVDLERRACPQPRTPRRYRLLIFDIDDTLIDFRSSEAQALSDVRAGHFAGVPVATFRATHAAVNGALWSALEMGEVTWAELRGRRFEDLGRLLGVRIASDDIATAYEDALIRHARLLPGVVEALELLAIRYRLAAVSNGFQRVVRAKAERTGLARLLQPLLVSEGEGVAKPSAEIFWRCLERVGASSHESLVVGDSWDTDGAGAAAAGIDFCWVRAADAPDRSCGSAILEVESVAELPALLV